MEQLILIIHVLAAVGLIGLILMQQGKGAEAGASFGAGASQTFFGSQGSGNFLTRTTAILVTVFFITSLGLGIIASHRARPQNLDTLLEKVQAEEGKAAPQPQEQKSSDDIPK